MTRFLQTILLTCFCHLLAAQAQEAGRYQLLTAQLQTQDGRSQTTVFKMDTATGQTWVYQMNSGTGVGAWIEVGGNPKGSPAASTTPNAQPQTSATPGATAANPNPAEQPTSNATADAVQARPSLNAFSPLPPASPNPALSLNSPIQQQQQTPRQQLQQSSEPQQPKSIHLTSPQIGEPVRSKNLVPLRAKIEEYNRIIQWGMANQNGAWIRDKNGEKVFVNPKQIKTMVEDAQAKKEDILKQMQDRNFWVNQFEK